MMSKTKRKRVHRIRRHRRVRKKVFGTAERPRLNVFRSNRHIYAQLVDDERGVTIAAASSLKGSEGGGKKEMAREVGKMVAKAALEAGFTSVQFDRGGYLYHGRVAAVAEGAREAGLRL
jgi:large subunit ribosomal protein L18